MQPACFFVLLIMSFSIHNSVQAEDQTGTDDRISLIIFAPKGPVLVDLQISVAGKPYRIWVTDFLSKRLDVDRSGGLSAREIERIPDGFVQSLGLDSATAITERAVQDQLFKPTTNDGAEEVAREVFNPWFSRQLSRSMQVIAQAVPPAEAVRLGELLDTSGNGSVDPEELAAGVRTLRFRDLDDDQTLSATELLPFRDPRNQLAAVTPEAADLPFIQLGSEESLSSAAERVTQRYGGDAGKVAFATMRTHPQLLTPHDLDSDKALDSAEFLTFLEKRSVHLTWNIQLSDRAAQSRIDIKTSPYARRFCRVKPLRRGRASLTVDDMPIEIRSHGGSGGTRRDLIGFLGQHFSIADADRDSFLTEDEFEEMSSSMGQAQLMIDFERADIDEDEQLSRDELTAWIETDTIATQSQIEVSVRQDGKTLFSLLDQNFDRRLAQRELQEGKAVLEQYDRNDDGQLAETELGTSYVLQIGLGEPEVMRQNPQGMDMEMTSTDAILPGIDSLTGPQWFRRMDRNQDGDLSQREFLGTREQFVQLDTDSDSLISADEAEAIATN
jgi:Ca2+-binding EF-hand superfamily protein